MAKDSDDLVVIFTTKLNRTFVVQRQAEAEASSLDGMYGYDVPTIPSSVQQMNEAIETLGQILDVSKHASTQR